MYAGLIKSLAPADTLDVVESYQLVPRVLVKPAAFVLWIAEIAIGVALMLPVQKVLLFSGSLLIASFAFSVFAVAQGINIFRGRSIPCGCFNSSATDRLISWNTVAINAAVAGLCLFVAVCEAAFEPPSLAFFSQYLVRVSVTAFLLESIGLIQLRSNNQVYRHYLVAMAEMSQGR